MSLAADLSREHVVNKGGRLSMAAWTSVRRRTEGYRWKAGLKKPLADGVLDNAAKRTGGLLWLLQHISPTGESGALDHLPRRASIGRLTSTWRDDMVPVHSRRGTKLLPTLIFVLAWAVLLAGLTLPTIAPEVANVSTLILMGIGLFLLAFVPTARAALRQRSVMLPLAAGLLLLLALAITAKSPTHIIAILVLAPLWLAGMHAGLLVRLGRRLTPLVIASFALVGTAGGAAIAAFDVLVRQQERGGFLVNNPIHLADLSLMLGFVALTGVLDRRPIRLLFLLGPVLALVAVWFSGSRGPLVAFMPLLVIGGIGIAWMTMPRRLVIPTAAVVVAAIGITGFAIVGLGLGGRFAGLGELGTVLLTGSSADGATSERLFMYQSAWSAFWASPWFGHGMIDYTTIARQYAPPGGPGYAVSEHLHSDIANFAVIGGGLGLLSYALLLVAPLAGGLAVRGPNRPTAIYLGLVAGVGYFSMGLTNAMFGVLSQTVVYAVILALIAALGEMDRGGAIDNADRYRWS